MKSTLRCCVIYHCKNVGHRNESSHTYFWGKNEKKINSWSKRGSRRASRTQWTQRCGNKAPWPISSYKKKQKNAILACCDRHRSVLFLCMRWVHTRVRVNTEGRRRLRAGVPLGASGAYIQRERNRRMFCCNRVSDLCQEHTTAETDFWVWDATRVRLLVCVCFLHNAAKWKWQLGRIGKYLENSGSLGGPRRCTQRLRPNEPRPPPGVEGRILLSVHSDHYVTERERQHWSCVRKLGSGLHFQLLFFATNTRCAKS